jgi:cytoskeletal protein RodZ
VIDEVHKLGEVLRTAREAKGVDLSRVERETKIRERYLSALERGDYPELPGAVYTKGFLRNYAGYLGLDPEYLIDLYRLETSGAATERSRAPSPPRPMKVRRRRTFVVSQGAVAAAILTLIVGGFVAWLGWEFVNFARMPELRVIEPAGDVAAHDEESITVRGVTEPNATITVSGLRENPTVTADEEGNFEVTVGLVPGSNVIRLSAHDPVTERTSEPIERTVQVVNEVATSPSATPVPLVIVQPAADASVSGPVAVAGTAEPGTTVSVGAVLVSAGSPRITVTDGGGTPVTLRPEAPTGPEPAALTSDATGAFSGSLDLAPGTWDVTLGVEGGEPVTRRVTVAPAAGMRATLRLEGGDSYLEVSQDGTPVAESSGQIVEAESRVSLSAQREIRILAGNAGAVRLTVNGISLGAMGGSGAVIEWRITPAES